MQQDHGFKSGIDRRKFLGSTTALLGSAALPGCVTTGDLRRKLETENASAYVANDSIVIDMHCHLMNVRDIHGPTFLGRRKSGFLGEVFGTGLGYAILGATWFTTSHPDTERRRLQRTREQGDIRSDAEFIQNAYKEQLGIKAQGDKQLTGIFSNRDQNAARLMRLFPNVNIFMPSMVDLFEGNPSQYSSLRERALVYKELNLLTKGRFLPMVCFNPERQLKEQRENGSTETGSYKFPINLMKECIREMGFIGVKVHPSSGFSPYDNAQYGCYNSFNHKKQRLNKDVSDFYDECMAELYRFCKQEDVPILTHSGTSIAANPRCMTQGWHHRKSLFKDKYDHIGWTNNPLHWRWAMHEADKANPDLPPLRVCLAHFAGGFVFDKGQWKPHPFLEAANQAMRGSKNLCTDLSILAELFAKEGDRAADETFEGRFIEYLAQNSHIPRQMMYGTDWHMPTAAMEGKRYLPGMQNVLEKAAESGMPTGRFSVSDVMGNNAVDFFGLRKGRKTRERLERFYKKHEVNISEIHWMNNGLV